jgi:hypothetical protein
MFGQYGRNGKIGDAVESSDSGGVARIGWPVGADYAHLDAQAGHFVSGQVQLRW